MTHDIVSAAAGRRRTRLKAVAFTLVLAVPAVIGIATAALASHGVNCNGVFPGKTPDEPIQLAISPAEVEIGDTVFHAITWEIPTGGGTANVDLVDCFLVDYDPDTGASNETLDPLVESMSVSYVGPNTGSVVLTIAVPNEAALVGHQIWARVKCTNGCKESKSGYFSFGTIGAPDPDPDPTPTPTPTPTDDPTPTPTPTPDPTQDPTPDPTPDPDPTQDPTPDPTPDPVVDDDTETDEDSETVVGGTQETNEPQGSVVAGTRQTRLPGALADTGSETTFAWLGVLFLSLGVILRSGRLPRFRFARANGLVAIAPVGNVQTLLPIARMIALAGVIGAGWPGVRRRVDRRRT